MLSIPRVSVIIPVHNSEKYLRQCLDSVSGQTLKEIEVICVDDGSEDDSSSILADYSSLDERFVVVRQDCSGAGAARNKGMSIARGEWLAFLDSDDYFEPTMLEEAYARGTSAAADMVLFGANSFDQRKGSTEPMPWSLRLDLIPSEPCDTSDLTDRLFQITKPAPWTKLFRHQFVLENDVHFQALHNTNDLLFSFLSLALAKKIAWVEKPLVTYRKHGESTQGGKGKHPEDFYLALRQLRKELEGRGVFSKLRESYFAMANEMVEWSFKSFSANELPLDRREFIRNDLGLLDGLDISVENSEAHLPDRNRPLVSVVIPVFNTEQYLEECIRSVLAQSLESIEIVCVDDASTDESLSVLHSLAEEDSRIVILSHDVNKGLYEARRSGARKACGQYVLFLDSDDSIDATVCEESYREAVNSGADVIQYSMETVYYTDATEEHKKWRAGFFRPLYETLLREDIVDAAYVERRFATSLVGKLLKKDLLDEAYSFAPSMSLYVGEDIFFFFFVSFFAEKYRGIKTEGKYRYCFGRGVSNLGSVELGKFEAYAAMGRCAKELRVFLDSQHMLDRLDEAYLSVSSRMLTDVLRMFRDRIEPFDKDAAAELVLKYWRDSEVLVRSLRNNLELTLKEFIEFYHVEVPLADVNADIVRTPRVSVIIPCFNVGKFVGHTLDSVLIQTLADYEVICVNDGSTDSTLDVLKEYALRDDRIVVVSKKNGGQSSARNYGLEYARGEYVYYLDGDDAISPTCLEVLCGALEESDLDMLFFSGIVRYEGAAMEASFGANRYYYYHPELALGSPCSGSALFCWLYANGAFRVSACMQIARRSFLLSVGARFLEGALYEDNLYTFRTVLQARRVMWINDPLFIRLYRRDSTMTSETNPNHVIGYLRNYIEMMSFLKNAALDETTEAVALDFAEMIKRQVLLKASELSPSDRGFSKVLPPFERYVYGVIGEGAAFQKERGRALRAERKISDLKRSNSYRVGRAATWLPRKAKKLFSKLLGARS